MKKTQTHEEKTIKHAAGVGGSDKNGWGALQQHDNTTQQLLHCGLLFKKGVIGLIRATYILLLGGWTLGEAFSHGESLCARGILLDGPAAMQRSCGKGGSRVGLWARMDHADQVTS